MGSHPVEGTTLSEVDTVSRICNLYNESDLKASTYISTISYMLS